MWVGLLPPDPHRRISDGARVLRPVSPLCPHVPGCLQAIAPLLSHALCLPPPLPPLRPPCNGTPCRPVLQVLQQLVGLCQGLPFAALVTERNVAGYVDVLSSVCSVLDLVKAGEPGAAMGARGGVAAPAAGYTATGGVVAGGTQAGVPPMGEPRAAAQHVGLKRPASGAVGAYGG